MGWVASARSTSARTTRCPWRCCARHSREAGCTEVRTYIQSGNVLFQTRSRGETSLQRRLEKAVAGGVRRGDDRVPRTWAELRRVASAHPFGRDTSKSALTLLAAKPSAAAVRRLRALDIAPDEVKVAGHDVYIRYPNGIQGSRLTGAMLERVLGVRGTNRNWRTVAKLVELTEG